MRKLGLLAGLSLKYLWRYRGRYVPLFIALSFGYGTVTLITAVHDGMSENVYNAAQDHYAGDVIAVGYDWRERLPYYLPARLAGEIEEAARRAGIAGRTVRRTLFGDRGVVYHGGEGARLKYVTGVDFQAEAELFGRLPYVRAPEELTEETIILSSPVAAALTAAAGDLVILEVETRHGAKNTGVFKVGGITNDTGIFGYYKAYVSRRALNGLLLLGAEDCGLVGIYAGGGRGAEGKRERLLGELAGTVETGRAVRNRDELTAALGEPFDGTKVFALTIAVYLSEVAELLGAMEVVTRFLYGAMLVIILLSALVSFRLALNERRREIGTMRAIGFDEADVRAGMLLETGFLALCAIGGGTLLSFALREAVGLVPFGWFPGFEIFLSGGRLTARYGAGAVMGNALAVFAALEAAAWIPAWKLSRTETRELLSGGPR
jgi:ABC-type lipoprotein release transport system permease subunit